MNCVICSEPFVEGEEIQAFLRCPEDPKGSWTTPVRIDSGFQQRCEQNKDKIKREHAICVGE